MGPQEATLNSNAINHDAMKLIDIIKNQGSVYLHTSHNPEKLMKIVSESTPATISWKHIEKDSDTYIIFVERKGSCCGVCQGH
jgi:hypothetical protein